MVLEGAIGGFEEGLDGLHESCEALEVDLLLTIAHGLGGIWVDLDEEAIGAEGDGALAEVCDEICAAAALAGVDDDWEVGLAFGDGDGGEVECVAGVGLEGADAAFAEHDVGVAVGEDVFGGEEPLFDALAHAAFEEDGFPGFGTFDEELEILRVAGSDLQDIRGGGHVLDIALAEDLGDDLESGLGAGGLEESQALFAEALKLVG